MSEQQARIGRRRIRAVAEEPHSHHTHAPLTDDGEADVISLKNGRMPKATAGIKRHRVTVTTDRLGGAVRDAPPAVLEALRLELHVSKLHAAQKLGRQCFDAEQRRVDGNLGVVQ